MVQDALIYRAHEDQSRFFHEPDNSLLPLTPAPGLGPGFLPPAYSPPMMSREPTAEHLGVPKESTRSGGQRTSRTNSSGNKSSHTRQPQETDFMAIVRQAANLSAAASCQLAALAAALQDPVRVIPRLPTPKRPVRGLAVVLMKEHSPGVQ
ncbi:hypothetical protein TREMEDRAFT_59521 [Tremella mesenterica DSM 1558]|uniref:uncharacterized protein n=1 Tax=Tremella mesenterica (strain ATCC 24925 / CBS 8224 / DSM 1558 / NBRC 9311 / NRRL Y-6157 / RJB 2259-6 / UBC 559-6) TaxID=578456 RepID=UPI0003F492B9|nr:uncharacterized protein TREMEDRAFT_59521 [Tremella mesenterica DSM 1558]EIW73355.1 hypothetical protein TREMEDRAFT_59521 [Tremella mesenterica DSM 1558]